MDRYDKLLIIGMIIFIIFGIELIFAQELKKDITGDTIRLIDCNGIWNGINCVFGTEILTKTNVADLKLNTPHKYYVLDGRDIKVAEFEIDSLVNYSGVFNDIEFYDINNYNKKINKTFRYKYRSLEEYQEILPLITVCTQNILCPKNVTYNKNDSCYNVESYNIKYTCENGTKINTLTRPVWINIEQDKIDFLSVGKITIGIFTDTFKGESIEWIPTLYNTRITEWANYTVADCSNVVTTNNAVITLNGEYCVFNFTTNGTFNVTSGNINVSFLIVGGGGGGGSQTYPESAYGSGGGAGGVVISNFSNYTLSGNNNVTVGLGGLAVLRAFGKNGSYSAINNITAFGGGGGSINGTGFNGGSGGGGTAATGGPGGSPGNSTQINYVNANGLGTRGGFSVSGRGTGGGGAIIVGENSTGGANAGKGGNGTSSNITGTLSYFAGGGGGGYTNGGVGGLGGGGHGQSYGGSDGTHGVNGTGGGGGGHCSNIDGVGWNGGNGIVIISFNLSQISDSSFPQFTNNLYNPANNSQYNNILYQFNITLSNTNGTVGLEFNGINYTATNISNSFYVNLTGLSAGSYTYYWWGFGNGSSHLFNISSNYGYTIMKNQTTTTIIANPVSPITYPTPTNFSCNNSGNITNKLYFNGIEDTIYMNLFKIRGATIGVYVQCAAITNANYTGSSDLIENYTIFQNSTYNMTILGISSINYGSPAGISNSSCPSEITCNLYRNNTGEITSPDNTILAVGFYNYTFNTSGNTNYSARSVSFVLQVNASIYNITMDNQSRVIWYKFNNDSSVGENYFITGINDYINNSNGSVYGNVSYRSNSSYLNDGSLYFNGSTGNYINVSGFVPIYNFTLCAWINSSNPSTAITDVVIGFNKTSQTPSIAVLNSGFIIFLNSNAYLYSTTNPIANTWYYVCADVHQNISDSHIYVNGVQRDGSRVQSQMGKGIEYFYVSSPVSGNAFNGSIDEVIFFNKTLSPIEISMLYYAYTGEECNVIPQDNCRVDDNINFTNGIYYNNGSLNSGAVNITGSNITVDCTGSSFIGNWTTGSGSFGFYITGDNVTLKNCIIKNYNRGISMTSDNLTIFNNSVNHTGRGIYGLNNDHTNITNNSVRYSNLTGIYFLYSNFGLVIDKNIVEHGINEDSISIYSTNNSIIRNNYVYNFSQVAISHYIKTSSNNSIINNIINLSNNLGSPVGQAISVSTRNFVIKDNIITNVDEGIVINTCYNVTVQNNTLFNITRGSDYYMQNMWARNSDNVTIINNNFTFHTSGIYIQNTTNINITNNDIRQDMTYDFTSNFAIPSAILISPLYKGWNQGNPTNQSENLTNRFQFFNFSGISIRNNRFYNVNVFMQTNVNISIDNDLANYYYIKYDGLVGIIHPTELYINSNFSNITCRNLTGYTLFYRDGFANSYPIEIKQTKLYSYYKNVNITNNIEVRLYNRSYLVSISNTTGIFGLSQYNITLTKNNYTYAYPNYVFTENRSIEAEPFSFVGTGNKTKYFNSSLTNTLLNIPVSILVDNCSIISFGFTQSGSITTNNITNFTCANGIANFTIPVLGLTSSDECLPISGEDWYIQTKNCTWTNLNNSGRNLYILNNTVLTVGGNLTIGRIIINSGSRLIKNDSGRLIIQ